MGAKKVHKIRKGLNLPILGEPNQKILAGREVDSVALLGRDYVGMKPTMLVKEGESVKLGQALFEDKKNPGVVFTSPASGQVVSINRGAKRAFKSVIVRCTDSQEAVEFDALNPRDIVASNKDKIKSLLLDSGLWTAIRTRPFGLVPKPDSQTNSIFVSAMDTNSLSPDPYWVIEENKSDFQNGLKALGALTDGKVFLARAEGAAVDSDGVNNLEVHDFAGPHPAGLVGTHIHKLDPVNENKTVWHVGYQDVIAIGKLLTSGKIWVERVVSIAGPNVKNPRLVRTRLGASVNDLLEGELKENPSRIVSGPLLSGFHANGPYEYFLGRYHNQVSVIEEDRSRELLGWQGPGFEKFSTKKVFLSNLFPGRKLNMTSTTHGSKRAMVPIGMYESVMPLDVIPTYLLRSLVSNDLESAVALGALELDEEDLGLCTFVCPGKTDYGPLLRNILTSIQKEG